MARDGAPGDGAEGLIDVVIASISILVVALLGLILWLNTEVFQAGATGDQAGQPAASTEDAPAGDGTADVDGDPGTAGDGETAPGPAGSGPAGRQDGTGSPAAEDADEGAAQQGGTADSGLFSADDPSRVPAITVSSAARGEQVRRADLDRDGVDERIWAAIVRDRVVIRVEYVVDGVWTPRTNHEGAPADRLLRLALDDLNDDGEREVYTVQWVATEGESATLWSIRNGDLAPMDVVGGCWGGGNTLGIVGTMVHTPGSEQPTIAAICPEEGQPRQRWPSALYRWDDGHWMYDGERGR